MRLELVLVVVVGGLVVGACVADPPEISSGNKGETNAAASGADDSGASELPNDAGASVGSTTGDGANSSATGSCGLALDAGGIVCGGSGPICCAVQPVDGATTSTDFACANTAAACTTTSGGVVVACRSRLDCGGSEVCCGRKPDDDTSVFATVKCESTCDGAYSYGQATFCDPGDPHACDAHDGFTYDCVPSAILPGLHVCERE